NDPCQFVHRRDLASGLMAEETLAVLEGDAQIEQPVDHPSFHFLLEDRKEARFQVNLFYWLRCTAHLENDGIAGQVSCPPTDPVGGALRSQRRQQCSQAVQNRFASRLVEI